MMEALGKSEVSFHALMNASCRLSLLPILAIAVPAALRAQAAPSVTAAPGAESTEIVVTAQKRSESLNKVPLSIAAASGETLRALGVTSVTELSKVEPSFVPVTSIYGTPVFYLRGVGFSDISLSAKPAVSIYADEMPLPYSVMAIGSTLDLERVEILEGPQGTLFGSNSTAGAINFIAAKPTKTLTAGGNFSYGRFNESQISGFVSGPLADKVQARFAIEHDGRGDWQYSYAGPNIGATNGSVDVTSARAIIEGQPTDTISVRLTGSGSINRSGTQTPQLIGKNPPGLTPQFAAYPLAPDNARATAFNSVLPYGKSPKRDDYQFNFSGRLDWNLTPNITLSSLTSYVQNKQAYGQDADGTSLAVNNLYISGLLKAFTQEVRLAGRFGEVGHWLVGGNLERDHTNEDVSFDISDARDGNVFSFLALPPIDLVPTDATTRSNANAGFADADYPIIDNLTVRAGVRYTDLNTQFAGCARTAGNDTYGIGTALVTGQPFAGHGNCVTIVVAPDGSGKSGLAHLDQKEHNVSWRAGLDYTPQPGTLLYATISRGYKAGAFSNIAAVSSLQYVPAKQEQLTSYEAGVKTDLFGRALHVNAAGFYYDYRNKQVNGTVDVGFPFGFLQSLVNIPKSRVIGFETEVDAHLYPGLNLTGAVVYLDTSVRGSFLNNTIFGPVADFQGTSFPNTPKWQLKGSGDYNWSVNANINAFLAGQISYSSRTNGDFVADQRLDIKPYSILDLQAGVKAKDDSWRAWIWGRNVANTFYYPTVTTFSEYIVRYTGLPATYGASVAFRFR